MQQVEIGESWLKTASFNRLSGGLLRYDKIVVERKLEVCNFLSPHGCRFNKLQL